MLTTAERNEKIASIRNLPEVLEAAVRGLTEEQLDTPESEGEWTVRQIVHHMADANLNFFARMKWALTEERPAIKLFEQERWELLPDATKPPIQASLLILRGLNQRWAILLENLSEASWKRKAVHPERGDLTLDDMLSGAVGHSDSHLEHLAKISAAKGW